MSGAMVQAASVASTTSLTGAPTPAVYGQLVTFTATVSGASGTPTGAVTFKDGASTLGTVALNAGGVASLSTRGLSVGAHTITAAYGGNSTYLASSGTLSETVNKASTTTSLAGAPNPALVGQTVTLTATVAAVAPGGGIPTGNVSFLDGATRLATVALNASGVATYSTGSLAVGDHSILAIYGGSGGYLGSSASLTERVRRPSTTTLSGAPNPSSYGQLVALTATVSGAAGTPTGVVTFEDGTSALGIVALNASATATWSTRGLGGGVHSLRALYSGSGTYLTSTGTLSLTVNRAASAVKLVSSANPGSVGKAVTFTATVSGPGATPAGSVGFSDGGTTLATVALSGGVATYSTGSLALGTHPISAAYGGSGNYLGSSASLSERVGEPSTTALSGAPNPAAFGQTVTLTARVSGAFGTPAGSVTFKDGTVALGSVALNASGVATYSTRSLNAGAHLIIALYGGSGTYGTSVSAVRLTVTPVVCSTPLPGTISSNTELKASTCDAYLSSGTTVQQGVTLTVDAGVLIEFNGTSAVLDVSGTLRAPGTASAPVTLTSAAASPQPGDWGGITVEKGGTLSASYATLADAGTGLTLNGESTSLDHATVTASASYGIYATSGNATALAVTNSTFSKNGGGVDFNAPSGPVTLQADSFTNNSGDAIDLYAPSVQFAGGGNSFSGNAGYDGTVIAGGGTISSSVTWAPGTTGSVELRGATVTVAAGATLTLAAGETVRATSYVNSSYAPALLDIQGTLQVQGTAGAPVTLTSAAAQPQPGDWGGIQVEQGGTLNLSYTTLSDTSNALNLQSGTTSLKYVSVAASSSGIYATGNASLSVANSTVTSSGGDGIYAQGGVSLSVVGSTISHNAADGVRADGGPTTIQGDTFNGNGGNAVSLGAPNPTAKMAQNSFSGNGFDGVWLDGGTLTQSATWSPTATGVGVRLFGQLTVASGATLTLAAGQRLLANPAGPALLDVSGTLAISGTAGAPVTLTSAAAQPQPGDWGGIQVEAGASGSISYATVAYASTALNVAGSASVSIHNSNIVNDNFGISNCSGCTSVQAQNNYWGTDSGPAPFGSGPGVSYHTEQVCDVNDNCTDVNVFDVDAQPWSFASPPQPPASSGLPGGLWVNPANGETIGDSLSLEAWAYPSTASGAAIAYVNFTAFYGGAWHVVCKVTSGSSDGFYQCPWTLAGVVPAGDVTVSFDVYDTAGQHNLAPNGTHVVSYVPGGSAGSSDEVALQDDLRQNQANFPILAKQDLGTPIIDPDGAGRIYLGLRQVLAARCLNSLDDAGEYETLCAAAGLAGAQFLSIAIARLSPIERKG